ncbi:hypothetical protein FIBSPDRAFT_545784 [Athelia psychrophila]|uniref:Secreted protein n=1 Tax=Athelia psychrophila TaxID=1759441 RepID=A0A167TEX5_9AGAM|nr:hypothetical protein FIBSPDRAFT_545784 [Fibularhizoctonia sp. CBS 109695]
MLHCGLWSMVASAALLPSCALLRYGTDWTGLDSEAWYLMVCERSPWRRDSVLVTPFRGLVLGCELMRALAPASCTMTQAAPWTERPRDRTPTADRDVYCM